MSSGMSSSSTDAPDSLPKIGYGIDFGSSSIRVAIREQNKPPQVVTGWDKGETHDGQGKAVSSYQFPTDIAFRGYGEFEIMGCRPQESSEQTASGVKQSLDESLCRSGEGKRFIDLCDQFGIRPADALCKLFRYTLDGIVGFINKKYAQWTVDKSTVAIPAVWAQDQRGIAIQNQLAKVAAEAGFPADTIDFEVEPICILGNLQSHKKDFWQQYSGDKGYIRLVVIDIGASTIDAVGAVADQDQFAVISKPLGDCGGMANAWRDLKDKSSEVCQGDAKHAVMLFNTARQEFFKMPRECRNVEMGSAIIEAQDFQAIRKAAFEKPLAVIRQAILATPNLDIVYIVGGASASNDGIRALIQDELDICRGMLRKQGDSSGFVVEFQAPDDAAVAVCLGAALPWPVWKPEDVFNQSWFGIICKRDGNKGRGRPPTRLPIDHEFLLVMKDKASGDLEEEPETLVVGNPALFTIFPAYDSFGDPVKGYVSPETGRQALPLHHRTIFMDPINLDLSNLVKEGESVRVRFKRQQHAELITLEVDCGKERELQEKKFVLDRDRTRLRLKERSDVHSANDEVYEFPSDEESAAQMALGRHKLPNQASRKRPRASDDKSPRISLSSGSGQKRIRQSLKQRLGRKPRIRGRHRASQYGSQGTPIPRGISVPRSKEASATMQADGDSPSHELAE